MICKTNISMLYRYENTINKNIDFVLIFLKIVIYIF